jgi:hypothetical protein
VLVGEVAEQRGGVEVDAIVSATAAVGVQLRLRRLPSRGTLGDLEFRVVDSASRRPGAGGDDLFLTLHAGRLTAGNYLGQVVATSRGRDVVRSVRFTIS